jgi:nuclear pore complex protein Nup98-Nup96
MEAMLDPEDSMDFRLPFLLMQTLDTLGYRHVSEACRMKIYTSLAEQLESQGLWEYSVFVMLHVADDNQREIAVQQLLYRHVHIEGEGEDDAKEKFLVEQLRIPEKWLNFAKAVRAGAMGSRHLEVKYLLKAEQWSKAHDVMMQHIAPDLVINDQMEFLKSLLEQFKVTGEIQNWKTQGEVLANFIELNEKVSLGFECRGNLWESPGSLQSSLTLPLSPSSSRTSTTSTRISSSSKSARNSPSSAPSSVSSPVPHLSIA